MCEATHSYVWHDLFKWLLLSRKLQSTSHLKKPTLHKPTCTNHLSHPSTPSTCVTRCFHKCDMTYSCGTTAKSWREALQQPPAHYHALPHTVTHCNALQRTATHCNALPHYKALQHATTQCNTYFGANDTKIHLHSHICTWNTHLWSNSCSNRATACNTLKHNTLKQKEAQCNTLQDTATHLLRSTRQHTMTRTGTYCNITWHNATYCNIIWDTLQHAATTCHDTHAATTYHDTLVRHTVTCCNNMLCCNNISRHTCWAASRVQGNTMQQVATDGSTLQCTPTHHCKRVKHTVIHCNTPVQQHRGWTANCQPYRQDHQDPPPWCAYEA